MHKDDSPPSTIASLKSEQEVARSPRCRTLAPMPLYAQRSWKDGHCRDTSNQTKNAQSSSRYPPFVHSPFVMFDSDDDMADRTIDEIAAEAINISV
ncbi:hypothetical protein L249_1292 [Ophiocordyceps polyrhachis-furcata BCC 54312]|uniref:Uncharacterized protein n=1 Tax=Ophiocordyceps polyrhachis-furcata BCC 54312 TaxID=1330021 RepID=A0A367LD97_9HYPO|nr:hypothetical protein L249_1292 [Ophiocordyceps polyrhachis-furcata BCC 54312]